MPKHHFKLVYTTRRHTEYFYSAEMFTLYLISNTKHNAKKRTHTFKMNLSLKSSLRRQNTHVFFYFIHLKIEFSFHFFRRFFSAFIKPNKQKTEEEEDKKTKGNLISKQ